MASSKEMRALVKEASKAGCDVERLRNGHTRITAPNGVWRDVSFSPGTSRAVKEQQSQVRKFLACNID